LNVQSVYKRTGRRWIEGKKSRTSPDRGVCGWATKPPNRGIMCIVIIQDWY